MATPIIRRALCVLLLSLFLPNVFSANILFFFAGGNVSHKTAAWPWVLELAKRGHNVTFVSPHQKIPVAHPNITDLAVKPLQDVAGSVYQVDRFKDRDDGREKDFDYVKISTDTCKAVVDNRKTDPELSRLFTEDNSFDLVFVNSIFGECGFFVGHHFKAKTVTYHSCTFMPWFYDVYGVSLETAWIPDIIQKFDNIPLTLYERAYNTFLELDWTWTRKNLSPMLQSAAEPLLGVGNTPSLYELENRVSLVFMNAHPSMDFARTLPPLFIDVGGMASGTPEKEMPKNFKDFMDSSGPGGVILITFGSTVLLNKVSTRYQAMFFNLMHEFPHVKFLMRWNGPMPKFLDSPPKNLMVSEWLPQKEILGHPKIKLFMTHGGVSSIQESTYAGVPMIVIPLFADQDYNAYRIEAQEVGLRVEIRDMTESSLVNVVAKGLNDNKYKKNMMRKSAIFRDRPLSPVDTAVFWTEFALRHEDTISTFRPNNQHLNMFQRRLLDVYLLSGVALILVCGILLYILKFVLKLLLWGVPGGRESQKRSNKRKVRKVE